jgi:hypothetical protein
MTATRSDELLTNFGTEAFTLADYQRERAVLERHFLSTHGTHAEDIDIAIRRGVLPCTDPLVEEWTALQALEPYVGVGGEEV